MDTHTATAAKAARWFFLPGLKDRGYQTYRDLLMSDLSPVLERIAIALEKLVELQSQPANGRGPDLYRELGEYRWFDWNGVGATVVSSDSDGATEVRHAGTVYQRRCKNGDIWFSSKTGTEEGEPTYSRLITFKVGHEIEELPKSVKRAVNAAPPPEPKVSGGFAQKPTGKLEASTQQQAEPHYSQQPVVEKPAPRVTEPNPKTEPHRPGKLTEPQCKRLHVCATKNQWSKLGLRLFLAEVHSIASGSAKDIPIDSFDLLVSQLENTPPSPYNQKGEYPGKRLQQIAKTLGLPVRKGNALIKDAIAQQCGNKESWQLSEVELTAIRTKLLFLYGMFSLPDDNATIALSELVALPEMAEDEAEGDAALCYAWMDRLQALIKRSQLPDALERRKDLSEADLAEIPF